MWESVRKRLASERRMHPDLELSPLAEVSNNRLAWILQVPGPVGSVYEGTTYDLEIAYERTYPYSAPYLRFLTPIFHPNIHPSGRMSNLMVDVWSSVLTVGTLFERAQMLLAAPIKEFPYNDVAADLWWSGANPDAFAAAVAAFVASATAAVTTV